MKKLLLLCSIMCAFVSINYAQTLSLTSASTIASGGTVTITGASESNSASGKYFNAFQRQSINSVTPTADFSSTTLSNVSITYFNKTTSAPTVIVDKIVNTSSVAIKVVFEVVIEGYDNKLLQETAPQTFTFTVTVQPPVTTFYSAAYSGTFTRNNCQPGLVGGNYTYTVPYGFRTSTTNQALADQAAVNYVNEVGQGAANASAGCIVPIYVKLQATNITTNTETLSINVYSDAACTLPLNLTNALTVPIQTEQTGSQTSPSYSTNTYSIPSGVNNYLIGTVDIYSETFIPGLHGGGRYIIHNYAYSLVDNGTYILE